MADTFSSGEGYDVDNNGVIPDLFPPLGFGSIPMGRKDSASSSPRDNAIWQDSSLIMGMSPPQAACDLVAGPSCNNNTSSSSSSSQVPTDTPADTSVFHISWGGDDKPPADLHLEENPEIVSRKPLPKPRGIRRLPEPEPAEDGTVDEDTLRRRRNTYAARRSRLKKFLKIEFLENKVNQLQSENGKLVLSNALLESEKRGWLAKEAEYKKRIRWLEESKGFSPES
ncbi:hypothetical protein BX666DRAFT_1940528 [Dichotomocladium elegans]|nr:hypothetical protein BX666DRAFT_1940528 [Dichotomocladium elegans]